MRGISRWRYLAWGLGLAVLKYALDSGVSAYYGRPFSAWYYWLPVTQGLARLIGDHQPEAFGHALVATPFVCLGVWLSVMRLRRIGRSPAFAGLFFIPLINLIFFLAMLVAPDGDTETTSPSTPEGHRLGVLPATLAVAVGAFCLTALCTLTLRSYGWGLFFAVPVAMGVASEFLVNKTGREDRAFIRALQVTMLAQCLCGALLLAFAVEGVLCLLMAAPLGFLLGSFGVLIGNIVRAPGIHRWAGPMTLATSILAAPLMAAIESTQTTPPPIHRVDSFVEINAPPESVWPIVIVFPEIPAPQELLFRAGIAYPIRARIEGTGAGAIRYCEFSTGPFVEPITIWEPNQRLAFSVTSNPEPMRELSFFDIHPPHLQGFLASQKGEFRLEALDDGRRTRLHGSTWYRHGLEPASYWRRWTDAIIHRIHARVLEHIKTQVELTN
jgi:hypothetical protein